DAHDAINLKKINLISLYNLIVNFTTTLYLYGKKWKLNYTRIPFAFKAMTKYCEKKLKTQDYDIIFQTQTLFSASFNKPKKPYYLYVDYTYRYSPEIRRTWVKQLKKIPSVEWESLENSVFKKADKIFTYNSVVAKNLSEIYCIDPNKIKTVGVGVNLKDIKEIKRDYDFKTILFVTSEGSIKIQGLSTVIKAFEILNKKYPDTRLKIVGYKLKNDPENVESFGFMPLEKFKKMYEQATIFVMPGLSGGPQSTLEAMSKKCICIGGKNNALLHEIIIDGETGFEVKPYDPQALAERMAYVINNKNRIKKIGEAAYKNLIKKFTWQKVAENIHKEICKKS
ncbi:MAG: glycosyltransferase family 4 protein, partial [Nanoarchaeota archaeon]|nr:glycosyltransferase family 4 protein [Nanoarchaeota archaeon]